MRVGPSVGPGSTWGESGTLSRAWEHLGREWSSQWGQGAPGVKVGPSVGPRTPGVRVGPSVGPGSTWGEGGALSGAREHLGREWSSQWGQGAPGVRVGPSVGPGTPGVRVGPSVGPGSTWGESGALSGAREHLG